MVYKPIYAHPYGTQVMPKRKLDAQQVIDDIQAGMDDHALMQKYNLSAKGLSSLFQKLVNAGALEPPEHSQKTRPAINAKDALEDIRAGMDDSSLMRKYRVTAKGLQDLFRQLTDAGLIDDVEIDRRMSLFDSTVDVTQIIEQMGFGSTPPLEKEMDVPRRCPACRTRLTMVLLGSPYECPFCGSAVEPIKSRRTG
jgi:hypothetical protein